MQIIKPNKLSLIHKAYQFGKEKSFSVGVLSFFSLGRQGDLLPEYLAWPKIMPFLQNGAILDMGFPKPSAEMLLAGNAYAPNAQPVVQMDIHARIGDIQKRLRIVGDRTWNGKKGHKPTDAIPFSRMLLSYANAFGGEGFVLNPCGRAHAGKDSTLLPNIYYAGQEQHVYQKKPVDVAGVSPLDITWPERSQYNGTYDKMWHKNTFPGFPMDTDRRLFLAAPVDQRCEGWIAPDAHYEIQGMHPTLSSVAGNLPGIVARIFVQLQGEGRASFVEASTVIDTVWFFPEAEIGVAIHRGEVAIADGDALDVDILLLACEAMHDKPREGEYYRQVMSLRSNPETALAHTLHDAQLLPQKSAAEKAHIQSLYVKVKQEQKEREASIRAHYQKQITDTCSLDVPEFEESQATSEMVFDPIPQELLMSGDVDLSPLLAQVKEVGDRKLAELKEKMAELEKRQKEDAAQQEPQKETRESWEDMRLRVFSPVYVVAQDLVAKDPGPLMARSAPMLEMLADLPQEQQAVVIQNLPEALKKLDQTKREGRQHSPDPMAPERSLPVEGALQIRQWVEQLLQQGHSLAGRDFAGADLHDIDFSHQDLRDVMFEKANLKDCIFVGCRLEGAVFTGASLLQANFCNAKLLQANLSKAQGEGADFTGADLSYAMLSHAQFPRSNWSGALLAHVIAVEVDLRGATLDDARCMDSMFHHAMLEKSCWNRVHGERCIFLKPNLKYSIWTASTLSRCMMIDAQAEGIRMDNVQWQKVQCSNVGDFRGANMEYARMEVCGFRGVNLNQVVAKQAVFMECDFGNSTLHQATLTDSLFLRCVMMQVSVQDANLQKSFFQEGSLRKVQFKNSILTDVVFSHMDMSEVVLYQCNIKGMQQRAGIYAMTIEEIHQHIRLSIPIQDKDFASSSWVDEELTGAVFCNCRFVRNVFQNCNLTRVTFLQCDFTEGYLLGNHLLQASFVQCQMLKVAVQGTCKQVLLDQCSLVSSNWEQVSLEMTNLSRCDFAQARWVQCHFYTVSMLALQVQGTLLDRCTFTCTSWMQTSLQQIVIKHCHFQKALLLECELSGQCFDDSTFSHCTCTGSRLSKCSFRNAYMIGSNFSMCALTDVDFTGAIMDTALFIQARITKCDFHKASLRQSNFQEVHMEDVILCGCNMSESWHKRLVALRCDYTGVNLCYANMTYTNLERCSFVRSVLFRTLAYAMQQKDCDWKGATPKGLLPNDEAQQAIDQKLATYGVTV